MNGSFDKVKSTGRNLVLGLGPIVVLLVLWEVSVRTGLIKAFFLPPFSQVMEKFRESLSSGDLLEHFGVSLKRMSLTSTCDYLLPPSRE